MFRTLLSGPVLALVLSAAPVFAHEHKVMGTVTMAAADHVMMKTAAGKEVTVKITADTKVTEGKVVVKPETIKEGTRLVVTTVSDIDPYTAMSVQVGAAPKTPPAKKSATK